MSKLPQTSSEMVREMRHRELITPPTAPKQDEAVNASVDVLAVLALTGAVS